MPQPGVCNPGPRVLTAAQYIPNPMPDALELLKTRRSIKPVELSDSAALERREWSLCPRPAARAERWSRSRAAVSDSLMGRLGLLQVARCNSLA